MSARVLIVVTHLLGTGHLARAMELARGFARKGDEVVVCSGGMPEPHLAREGLPFVQLPPLRSEGTNFSRLLDADGHAATPALFAERSAALTDLVQRFRPEILITELFPFGRRPLKNEFIACLSAAHALPGRTRIFASVRDILAPPSKPRKAAFAEEMLVRYYDKVLVHADPAVVALDASWPVSREMHSKLAYTGFVAPPLPEPEDGADGIGEVLVSAGGGPVGARLYDAALKLAHESPLRWRLLVGGHDAADRCATLRSTAAQNVTVELARPDFRSLLQRCAVSISLTGYNTAMDVLQAGVPAVMVAFDDGSEVEQSLRAKALAALPQIETIALSAVTPATLRDALDRCVSDPHPRDTEFDFNGAAQTREICLAELAR